jgi:hypothetical protein
MPKNYTSGSILKRIDDEKKICLNCKLSPAHCDTERSIQCPFSAVRKENNKKWRNNAKAQKKANTPKTINPKSKKPGFIREVTRLANVYPQDISHLISKKPAPGMQVRTRIANACKELGRPVTPDQLLTMPSDKLRSFFYMKENA